MASPTVTLKLAMFQGRAKAKDVQHNLAKMKEQIVTAKKAGTDLIVFPELFLTDYNLKEDEMMSVAEEKDGKSFQELSALAKDSEIAILYGYPEIVVCSEGRKVYNSAQLIDRNGQSLVNYHKVHPWIDDTGTEKVFTAGEGFSDVIELCGLKIGILICYDVDFPESVRTLALKGADLVLVPTASVLEYIARILVPARAIENRIHVAYVNYSSPHFIGGSMCCNQEGVALEKVGNEERLLFATIDPSSYTEPNTYLRDRRPSLYEL